MARPTKSNADYFKHDNDMRNDPKVKALRGKFGLEGYAVWNMILETLTDADGFWVQWNSLSIELFSGDFGLASERLEEMAAYMEKVGLIQIEDEKLLCKNLSARMQSVVEKREKMQERYFLRVSAAEKTQKRREESRVEEKTVILEDMEDADDARDFENEIEKAISTLEAEKEKKSPLGRAAAPLPPLADLAAQNPAIRNTYLVSRRLPAERFEEMVAAFDTESELNQKSYTSEAAKAEHFLNWAANRIRIEQEEKQRPLRPPARPPKSIITRAGADPEHYRKPQAF